MTSAKSKKEADHLETLVTLGNAFDRKIVRGIPGCYGDPDFTGKRVLDIGAQIGSFSVYAAWKGAKEIYAVEPLPRNIELLRKNTARYPQVRVYPAAAVKDTSIPRTITSGAEITDHDNSNFGHNVLRKTGEMRANSRTAQHSVELVSFKELLGFNPHIIKMDCEGSEHELLEGYVASPIVEALLLEVHFFEWSMTRGWPQRLKNLLDQGFKIVRGRESIINGTGQYGILTLLRDR